MAVPSVVQSAVATTGGSQQNSVDATFAQGPTQGNLLVAFGMAHLGGNQDPTVADFTELTTIAHPDDNLSTVVYTKIAGASESATVTLERASGNARMCLIIVEVEGQDGENWLDQLQSANGPAGTTSQTTGTTGTTDTSEELLLALVSNRCRSDIFEGASWSNSFTAQDYTFTEGSGNSAGGYWASRPVTSTGQFETTLSGMDNDAASNVTTGIIFTIRAEPPASASLEATVGDAQAEGLPATVIGFPLPPEFEMWPVSDVSVGSWEVIELGFVDSGEHFSNLNSEDNLTGITHPVAGLGTEYGARLDEPPDTPTGATVFIRHGSSSGGDLVVQVREGTTLIAQDTFASAGPTVDTFELSQAEVESVNDWSNVRIRLDPLHADSNTYEVNWLRVTAEVVAETSVTLQATVGEATADGLDADVTGAGAVVLEATVGEALAEGLEAAISAGAGVTLEATTGEATAEGLAGEARGRVAASLEATVGEATADGLDAQIAAQSAVTLSALVGEAVAEGLDADATGVASGAPVVLEATVGEATATGLDATVSAGTAVTLEATVGEATASGLDAVVAITAEVTLQATVGEALAEGLNATTKGHSAVTVSATTGEAFAEGLPATVSIPAVVLAATTGEAVAEGLPAEVVAEVGDPTTRAAIFVGAVVRGRWRRVKHPERLVGSLEPPKKPIRKAF